MLELAEVLLAIAFGQDDNMLTHGNCSPVCPVFAAECQEGRSLPESRRLRTFNSLFREDGSFVLPAAANALLLLIFGQIVAADDEESRHALAADCLPGREES